MGYFIVAVICLAVGFGGGYYVCARFGVLHISNPNS
jgi:hypothetical protein